MTVTRDAILVIGNEDVSLRTSQAALTINRELVEVPVIGGDLNFSVYGRRSAVANATIVMPVIPNTILNDEEPREIIFSEDRQSAVIAKLSMHNVEQDVTSADLLRARMEFSLSETDTQSFAALGGLLLAGQQSVSAIGALAGKQFSAVASGWQMQIVWAVTSLTGTTPSISFDIETDTSSAFSLPTARASVGPITSASSGVLTINGPVTDTWWRVNVTALTGTATLTIGAAQLKP